MWVYKDSLSFKFAFIDFLLNKTKIFLFTLLYLCSLQDVLKDSNTGTSSV